MSTPLPDPVPPRTRWELVALKYALLGCLCVWAVGVHVQYRVPGLIIPVVLAWIGVALGVLHAAMVLRHLLVRPLGRVVVEQVFGRIERIASFAAIGFVLYSGALKVNGALSPAPIAEHVTEVVALRSVEVDLGRVIRLAWVELKSWRAPDRLERVLVWPGEEPDLWPGQSVRVRVRWGYLLIPWIVALEPDEEQRLLRVVDRMPTAARAWKDLIVHYLDHNELDKAAGAAGRYLTHFPRDLHYAGGVARALGVVQRPAAVLVALEPVLGQGPDYDVYTFAGLAYHLTGRSPRGIELLEAAIPLEPGNYLAYLALGITYSEVGRVDDAVRMYEAAWARGKNRPQAKPGLAHLRKQLGPHLRPAGP
jgi:hypothetical protein